MSRRMLSRVFGLLVLAGLCIGAVVSGTSAAPAPAACPTVSCLTETGYYQCVGVAGCTCDPRNDWCVAISQPTPTPACPAVSCLTRQGYDECKQAGCGCDPRTDACVATKVVTDPAGNV
jgi:hypothetical protein